MTRVFCHLQQIFEYQGQTQYTRILELKPLVDTFYSIGHRLKSKYFHFAQFLLNSHHGIEQLIDLKKVRP